MIETAEGDRPIEEIQIGDLVLSANPETGEIGYKPVVNTYIHVTDTILYLTIDGETIETTRDHPFWVEGQGWTSAELLQAGDVVRLKDGSNLDVDNVEILELPEGEYVAVYNFEVADFHTYFVSDYDVLVHNKCKKKDIDALQNGSNGTTVNVKTKKEANALLKESFPDYQKVNGVGSQDASQLRRSNKMQAFKKGGAYHKDYGIDKKTGLVYGHVANNPHGKFPHINIKRTDFKKVIINITGRK